MNTLTPLFTVSLGASAVIVGVYAAGGMGVNALLRPIFGHASDTYGRGPLIVFGLSGVLSALALLSLATSAWMVVLAGVLTGVGAAAFWSSFRATIVETFSEQRERYLGYVSSAHDAGLAVGQMSSGLLLVAAGFRLAYATVALAMVVAVILAVALAPRLAASRQARGQSGASAKAKDGRSLGSLGRLLTSAAPLVTVAVGYALFAMSVSAFVAFLPLYLRDRFDLPVAAVGLAFAALTGARVASGLLVTKISAALPSLAGVRRVTVLVAVSSVALFAMGISGAVTLFLAFGVLHAFVFTLVHISVTVEVSERSRGSLAQDLGLVEGLGLATGLVGPLVGGAIYSVAPSTLFLFASAIAFVSGLVLLVGLVWGGRSAGAADMALPSEPALLAEARSAGDGRDEQD